MPSKWERVRKAFDFLYTHEGSEITDVDLSSATGWKVATVQTYVAKRWAGLLIPRGRGTYTVSGFRSLSWRDFQSLQTQTIRPGRPPVPVVYDYDVALSFAGEDRPYVEQVANIVRAYGMRVFYDAYEQFSLWGKDLYTHLDEVYRVKSRYCVMFVSQHYARKLWTSHERTSAQARALEERQEYILPVRFDDTLVPGLRNTTAYLDAANLPPQDIANAIASKLGYICELQSLISTLRRDLGDDWCVFQEGPNLVLRYVLGYDGIFSIAMLLEMMRSRNLNILYHAPEFPKVAK